MNKNTKISKANLSRTNMVDGLNRHKIKIEYSKIDFGLIKFVRVKIAKKIIKKGNTFK